MKWNVTWDKPLKERAKAEDRDLFAVAADTLGGRAEVTTSVPRGTAAALFRFAHLVALGSTPEAAFAEVEWPTEGGRP